MTPERRNKKNENYKKNLEKRYGLTKNSLYLTMVSNGIEKSETKNPMNGQYSFELTRHPSGNIGSRIKYVYQWTAQAKALQKLYHNTKNGIEPKVTKPIETFWDKEHTKEEIKEYFKKKKEAKQKRFEELPYSNYHKQLISSLYMSNKTNDKMIIKAVHDANILKLKNTIKGNYKTAIPLAA